MYDISQDDNFASQDAFSNGASTFIYFNPMVSAINLLHLQGLHLCHVKGCGKAQWKPPGARLIWGFTALCIVS
jgi:hypothetical protein